METPWIVANDATGPDPYTLLCERCNGRQRFDPPLSVDYFVGVTKAFVREHKTCEEKK